MSVLSVHLAIINLEGALFGIFFALSIASLCLLVNRRVHELKARSAAPVGWVSVVCGVWRLPLFVASALFVLIVTVHWTIGVRRIYDAFMYHAFGQSPTQYFSDLQHPLEIARTALLGLTMLIGDLVLTQRAWIVWNRARWVPLPPIVTCLALIACGVGILRQFSIDSPTDTVWNKGSSGFFVGFVVSTLLTKTYGTLLIAFKIYVTKRSLKRTRVMTTGRSILDILMIFVESSALSTAWTVFFVVVFAGKSTLQFLVTSCSPYINGIAFMLIIVRVGLGWDLDLHAAASRDISQTTSRPPMHLQAIQLHIATTVGQEADFAVRTEDLEKGPGSTVLQIQKPVQSVALAGKHSEDCDYVFGPVE